MRQSTIFFIVAVLVLIWFGAEAFPGQQICVSSCISLAGMNIAEQIAAVAVLPIIIVLAGFSMRKSEREKELKKNPSEGAISTGKDNRGTGPENTPTT